MKKIDFYEDSCLVHFLKLEDNDPKLPICEPCKKDSVRSSTWIFFSASLMDAWNYVAVLLNNRVHIEQRWMNWITAFLILLVPMVGISLKPTYTWRPLLTLGWAISVTSGIRRYHVPPPPPTQNHGTYGYKAFGDTALWGYCNLNIATDQSLTTSNKP